MRYPKAFYAGDGIPGGSYLGGPFRVVLHTTETIGMPGYNGGAHAPHMTYNPKTRAFVQHTPFNVAARALARPTNLPTNRQSALQLEVICYSDKSIANQSPARLWVGDLPETAYRDIAEWVWWCIVTFGVKPIVRRPRPVPKYGTGSPARMTAAEWTAFNGLCGHFEVPTNCVSADTPILCADLVWRPAGDLVEGDELVAFDEESLEQAGRRIRRSVVTHNEVKQAALLRVNTPLGSIRCNYDHPWLVRRGNPNQWGSWQWVRARDLLPGDEAMYVIEPWEVDRSHEAGWLAGMLDADGWLVHSANKTTTLGLAQREGLSHLVDDAERLFKEHGVVTGRLLQEARASNISANTVMDRITVQSREGAMRALGIFRPKRLLADSAKIWEGASLGRTGQRVPIESIEPWGTGLIASLTTSTQTYIAGGFAAHNTHWDPGAFDFLKLLEQGDDVEIPASLLARRMNPARIKALVEGGVIQPNTQATIDHWVMMITFPDSAEWENVREEIAVMGFINAALR